MKNRALIIILLIIVILAFIGYFFIAKFSTPASPLTQSSSTTLCQMNHVSASITPQGAAGNIYATLELTNTGKVPCAVVLGNTITAMFQAKNIVTRYEQSVPSERFILAHGAKVYSQIHYPNGPQCQNGISEKQIAFFYHTNHTSIMFQSEEPQRGKLTIQACLSNSEKTIIDIWPLSENPVTP